MARITVIPEDELGELPPPGPWTPPGAASTTSWPSTRNPRSMAAHQGIYESAMAGTATLHKLGFEYIC